MGKWELEAEMMGDIFGMPVTISRCTFAFTHQSGLQMSPFSAHILAHDTLKKKFLSDTIFNLSFNRNWVEEKLARTAFFVEGYLGCSIEFEGKDSVTFHERIEWQREFTDKYPIELWPEAWRAEWEAKQTS